MMRLVALLSLVVIGAVAAHSPARADCLCAANGLRYEQGEISCIRLSSGSYLARCEKVLNNSSWTKVSDGCQDLAGSDAQDATTQSPQSGAQPDPAEQRCLQD
ncbi:hypothetical protein [Aquibium carbonis]|uniref:hypothetical protein n=1 Tax=Aquibium carbonis TaxID=2495581 RepID=UPI001AED11F8|nr:hypothetical protein [Aquibium carbonis]